MLTGFLMLAASLQQAQQQAPPPALAPSPIARLELATGPEVTIMAGDSMLLNARPLDASGQPVPNAKVRYFLAGGYFEGGVDSLGMVRSGSTGSMMVDVVASVPGTKPYVQRLQVRMIPGPAARIAVTPAVSKLVVGQRVRLTGRAFSKANDERDDAITWRSSAASTARISSDGVVTALAPGRAVITASTEGVSETVEIQVVANTIASVEITPGRVEAREGDVVRFTAVAKDASGRAIPGLVPQWSFSPGDGQIEADGSFVGYNPGSYLVSASFGSRSADAPVTLAPREVRRAASVVGRLPRTRFTTEEVWIHPSGKYAYLGSGSGGDVMYAIDISDPSNPTVTDSVISNTRRVNDVMSTPDGKFLVFTREGASDRKNGIVIASI